MKVGLSLGSNVGDRLRHLQQARNYLLSLSPEQWHRASPIYETEPVNCPPGTLKFLNAVLEIEFTGAPRTLLKKLQAYEVAHGRVRTPTVSAKVAGTEPTLPLLHESRTIDLDILYFGERELLTRDLIIPHPRLAQRRFVLVPLATLHPDLIVKGTGKTVRMLLRELPERAGQVTFLQSDW